MLALDLPRFPHRRWADWLTRRAHALYRVEKKFRARMDGPHEREYCYTYLRHWLYIGLHKSRWKYADALPPEMREGHPPTLESAAPWKCSNLPRRARVSSATNLPHHELD